jgi:hypothetical protein
MCAASAPDPQTTVALLLHALEDRRKQKCKADTLQ